jgi:RimJ/RimL family protein N-acetyltransferase
LGRTSRKLSSFGRLLREERWRDVRAHLTRGLLPAQIFRYAYLFIERLDEGSLRSGFSPPGFALRPVDRGDLPALLSLRDRDDGFRSSFEAGYLGLLGHLGERPATLSWVKLSRRHVSESNGYVLEMPARSAWTLGAWVDPDLRGRGLYAAHAAAVLHHLRLRGVDRLYCAVEADNAASMSAHEKVGWQKILSVRTLRLAGLTFCRVRDLDSLGSARSRTRVGPCRRRLRAAPRDA